MSRDSLEFELPVDFFSLGLNVYWFSGADFLRLLTCSMSYSALFIYSSLRLVLLVLESSSFKFSKIDCVTDSLLLRSSSLSICVDESDILFTMPTSLKKL